MVSKGRENPFGLGCLFGSEYLRQSPKGLPKVISRLFQLLETCETARGH